MPHFFSVFFACLYQKYLSLNIEQLLAVFFGTDEQAEINNIITNKKLPIYGKGLNSREWIFVEDHCEALIKIFQKGKINNFYNIGSNKNLTNLDVCENLIKTSKKL